MSASKRGAAAADRDDEPGLLMQLLGRSQPQAPPEPTPFDDAQRRRPKKLTVPQDTVNALKLMAQDWVLEAREHPPRIRQTDAGGYVKEFNVFSDKYTLEIERADEKDDATLIGYVFLDSTYMRTSDYPTEPAAQAATDYREEPRRLRMTFRLLERWEFSELAEEFVFNRVWELARVQYKPVVEPSEQPAPVPVPDVQPPQATPHQ